MCSHNHSAKLPEYPTLNTSAGAKWIKSLTRDRLGTFLGGHFSDVNLSSTLFVHRLDGEDHVKLQVWSAPGLTKPSFEEAMTKEFRKAKKGEAFGPSCEYTWAIKTYLILTCISAI
jgi:alpha-mannosidase